MFYLILLSIPVAIFIGTLFWLISENRTKINEWFWNRGWPRPKK